MLKNLQVKNFKSIVNADLEFGRVNLFIGPNGGGKTNILEAIGLLSAALGRSVSPEDLNSRGVRLSLPRLFKSTFKNRRIPRQFLLTASTSSTEYTFTLSAGDDSSSLFFEHEKLTEAGVDLFGRSPRSFRIHKYRKENIPRSDEIPISNTRGGYDFAKDYIDISEQSKSELDGLISYGIYAPQTAMLRGMAKDPHQNEPLGLTGGRLSEAFLELIRAYPTRSEMHDFYFNIIWEAGWSNWVQIKRPDPNIVPPQIPTLPYVTYFRDKFMHSKRQWLSAYDASEGSLFLMFAATLLAHPKAPNVFAMDNVDGTLNPGLVRRLVEHIVNVTDQTNDKQVFLTSHNPTALDALDLFNPDHRIYVVSRDKETGQTKFNPVLPREGTTKADWVEMTKGRNTSVLLLEKWIQDALN